MDFIMSNLFYRNGDCYGSPPVKFTIDIYRAAHQFSETLHDVKAKTRALYIGCIRRPVKTGKNLFKVCFRYSNTIVTYRYYTMTIRYIGPHVYNSIVRRKLNGVCN